MSNGISTTGAWTYARDTAWHEIGAGGEPAFGAGWSNYSGAFASAAFRMDSEGWVHMKGLVKSAAAINAGGTVLTLPVDYRPAKSSYFRCIIDNRPGYIAISNVGVVQVQSVASGATNAFISLQEVKFPAWLLSSQFKGQQILPLLSQRVGTDEWPISLWKRKTGMYEVFGIGGALSAVQTRLGGLSVDQSCLFPTVDNTSDVKEYHISPAIGHNQVTVTNTWAMQGGEVGSLEIESKWSSLTMLNSWVSYGNTTSGRWVGAQYWKDPDGWVHLRGLVKNGSSATANIAVLPSGYRPALASIFMTISALGTGACRVDVAANGTIVNAGGGSTAYTSLAGICFYADQ